MKRPIWTVVITVVMTTALGAVPARAAAPQTSPAAVPAAATTAIAPPLYDRTAGGDTVRVNVVTDDRTDLAGAASAGTTLQSFTTLPIVTLDVDRAGLDRLAAQPGVVSVTEDMAVPPTLNESVPRIGANKAHAAGRTGAGSAIAVLDTGVASGHPFLAGRVVAEACFSTINPAKHATSLCPNGTPQQQGPGSADSGTGACATITNCDHGTHVAGIAAGGSAVAGGPNSGVAPGADIVAIQVFSKIDSPEVCGPSAPCVMSFDSDQIAGLEKVLQLKQAGTPIVAANLSLGMGDHVTACDTDPIKLAIDSLRAAGVATVIAAGNNGHPSAVNAPACVSSAIAVGSTSDDDQLSGFTNRGPLLDLLAPGTSITSSVHGGGYAIKSGTSMAAPHVAGAFAVLRQAFPDRSLTSLEALVKASGKTITYTGAATSRVDIGQALRGTPPPVADYDGDGRDDIATWYDYADGRDAVHLWSAGADGRLQAPTTAYTSAAGTWDASRTKLINGDFNGDRRGDIGLFYGYASGEVKLFTKSGKADGTFTPASESWTATDWTFARMNPRTGDFNGDGRTDIAVWYDYADGSDKLFTFLARPDGGFAHPISSWHRDTGWTFANMKLTSGDHNGDGRDDLAAMYFYSTGEVKLFTFLALATGGFDNTQIPGYTSTNWGAKERTSTVSGDFDGDGRDEVAAWYDYADGTDALITFSSNAQGVLGNRTVAWQAPVGHYTRDHLTLTSGDFNGDGHTDLAALYGYADGSIKMLTWPASPTGTFTGPLHGAGKTTGWTYGNMRLFTP
ncbi:S8 family serine peptidase [Streptomyces sp. NPDC020965]|uniref:S8 family serine peptidase n=1 Tax=Streptomyces sp. NPDC020965 TaxID=3365105 RepID=UPI0037A4B436